MGYLDKFKEKATGVARTRGESIGATVDKAATAINRRTGGKHADKVSRYAEQAKRKVDEFGQAPPSGSGQEPPSGPGQAPPSGSGQASPGEFGQAPASEAPRQDEGPPPTGPPIL